MTYVNCKENEGLEGREGLRLGLDRNKKSSNIKHNNENKDHGGQHEKGFSIGSFFVCVCF